MTDNAAAATLPERPSTVRYAVAAIVLGEVISLITVFVVWLSKSVAADNVIANNKRLLDSHNKSAHPADQFVRGSELVNNAVHNLRVSNTVWSLLLGLVFVALALAIWRGSGGYRWVYIVIAVLPLFWYAPILGLFSIGDGGTINVLLFLRALATLAAIFLLVLPPSIRFFNAHKAIRVAARQQILGASAGAARAPRPAGLRGLFAPVPPRPDRPTVTRTSGSRKPADTRPATRPVGASGVSRDSGTDSGGRGKPKARTGAPGTAAEANAPAGAFAADAASAVAPERARGKSRRI